MNFCRQFPTQSRDTMKTQQTPATHTPERPELSFDGVGINGPDEYRTRIATFADIRSPQTKKYGELFASAPALLAERDRLRAALELILEFNDGEHGEAGVIGCQAIEEARAALAEGGRT